MTDLAREPRGKGAIILQMKNALRAEFGEAAFEAAIRQATSETQAVVRGAVLSTGFYPERAIGELIAIGVNMVGEERFPTYARQIAKDQINTIFKFLLRLFISPQRFTDNNHKLWEAMHDSGKLVATHGADGCSHTLEITDFDFFTREYEQAFIEYHCGVLELTGAKKVEGFTLVRGPPRYVQKYTWET